MSETDKVVEAANALSASADCDVMIINGDMFHDVHDQVSQAISARKNKKKSLVFILATPGGLADSAYRISRSIQNNYENAIAIVSGWCKSAGTLCVIGAKEVVMFDDAELGPLDVQIVRRDELGERDSGLVLGEALANLEHHAFSLFESFMLQIKSRSEGSITFKTATEIATQVTSGLFEPIYKQIDPNKIGEAARSLAVAVAYGTRLNVWANNLKSNSIQNLTVGYPTHGFVIDRREANELFRRVRAPNEHEISLIGALGPLAGIPRDDPFVMYLNPEGKTDETSDKDGSDKSSTQEPATQIKTGRRARKSS